MSVETRLQNILSTHTQYNTLIEIEHRAKEFAIANIALGGYSEYQRSAAQQAAQSLKIIEPANKVGIDAIEEVLYLCAASRPSPCKWNDTQEKHYGAWKKQHSTPDLSQVWVNEIKSMGNRKLEALSSHLRLDDFSNEAFITSFKEGTVHRHDGCHSDDLDAKQ